MEILRKILDIILQFLRNQSQKTTAENEQTQIKSVQTEQKVATEAAVAVQRKKREKKNEKPKIPDDSTDNFFND